MLLGEYSTPRERLARLQIIVDREKQRQDALKRKMPTLRSRSFGARETPQPRLSAGAFTPSVSPRGIFKSSVNPPAEELATSAVQFAQQNPGVPNPAPAVQNFGRFLENFPEYSDLATTIIEGAPASARAAGFGQGNLPSFSEIMGTVLPPETLQRIEESKYLPGPLGPAAADVAAGFTNPLSLSTLGAGAVVSGPAAVALPAARIGAATLGAGAVGHGIEQTTGVKGFNTPIGPIGPAAALETAAGFAGPRAAVTGVAQKAFLPTELNRGRLSQLGREASETQGFVRAGTPPINQTHLDSFLTKMGEAFRVYKEERPQVKAARTAERATRLATFREVYEDNLRRGLPHREAETAAMSTLAGKYPGYQTVPNFTPTAPELDAFWGKLMEHQDIFERRAVGDAIESWRSGDPGGIRPFQIKYARKIFGQDFADILKEVRQQEKAPDPFVARRLADIASYLKVPQEVAASLDVSNLDRQQAKAMLANPGEWLRSAREEFKAYISEDAAHFNAQKWENDPTPIPVTLSDGNVQTITLGDIMSGRADRILGIELGEKPIQPLPGEGISTQDLYTSGKNIPGVKQSGQAFVTGQNNFGAELIRKFLRQDMARDSVLDKIQRAFGRKLVPRPITPDRIRAYQNFAARFTGRGTFSAFQSPHAKWLPDLLKHAGWAPGLRVSGPEAFAQLFHSDGRIRMLAAQNLGAWMTRNLAIMALMSAAGAKIGVRPNSTDFGKIVVGDTHYNIWGSDQLLARSIAQAATGKSYNLTTGRTSEREWEDVLTNYLRSGADPVVAAFIDGIVAKENLVGEKIDLNTKEGWLKLVRDKLLPLAFQDIYDVWRKDGPLQAIITAPFAAIGEGATSYSPAPSEYYAMPRWQGVTKDQEGQIFQALDQIEAQYQAIKGNNPEAPITKAQAANIITDPVIRQLAIAQLGGQLKPNYERINFAIAHQNELDGEALSSIPVEIMRALHVGKVITDENFQKYLDAKAER